MNFDWFHMSEEGVTWRCCQNGTWIVGSVNSSYFEQFKA
jgi:hypothetical protein